MPHYCVLPLKCVCENTWHRIAPQKITGLGMDTHPHSTNIAFKKYAKFVLQVSSILEKKTADPRVGGNTSKKIAVF